MLFLLRSAPDGSARSRQSCDRGVLRPGLRDVPGFPSDRQGHGQFESWPSRLVVRNAPLHKGSDTAVRILEAARQQGKYWEALERTVASQPQWAAHGNPQPEMIRELIADIGLDVAKAKAEAYSPAIGRLMRQDVADMRALRVNRTPGFLVNGTPLSDFGEAQLKSLVDQELK